MKAVILGAGQVGYSIARYLVQEDCHVTVVDTSSDVLGSISEKLDIKPVLGFASRPDALEKAGLKEADLVIAVTSSDEVNMVACKVANHLFNVPMKIARIRNQSYLASKWKNAWSNHDMSIDVVISPEIEVAKSVSKSTQVQGAFDVVSLANDSVKVVGVRCHSKSPIINTPIRLFNGLFPKLEVLIISINRKEKTFFPTEQDVLLADDEIYFLVKSDDLQIVMEAFGYNTISKRNLIVIGGGTIGQHLALDIENNQSYSSIKMIEKNLDVCEVAAQILQKTEIIIGDALDFDILQEANVGDSETVIAVTNDDKVNILASLIAKKNGSNRVLTLLNNMNYAPLVTSLGVDAVISPRALTVSTILRHIRQGKLHAAHAISEGHAIVVEAEAKENSNVIGLSIEDVTIQDKIFIVALFRNNQPFIAPSKSVISAGDRLIIVSAKEYLPKVEKLFSIRPSYL
jgi:trk system potassium uptake protein TrkA